MTTILNGLIGGLVVAGIVAGVAVAVRDGPSLAATVVAKVVGSDREDSVRDRGRYRWHGVGLSVVAGGLAGALLVALELYVLGVLAVPPAPTTALLVGGGWGLALFFVVTAAWTGSGFVPRLERRRLGGLLAGFLAYGVLLGLWIRVTWIT